MSLKVLIVDDDRNYRYAISKIIDWRENGYEIVGEAVSGSQALKMLQSRPVDLILTDISMPQMNGVELIKIVRVKYPTIKIIVLSAYDEFELVKESLRYGAEDYILKFQLNPSDILKCLSEVRKKISEDSSSERLLRFIQSSKLDVDSNVFKEALIDPSFDASKWEAFLKYEGFGISTIRYRILLIRTTCLKKHLEEKVLRQRMQEFCGKNLLVCTTAPQDLVVLLDFSGSSSRSEQHHLILGLAQELYRLLYADSGGPVEDNPIKIGVSDLCEGASIVHSAYCQACDALPKNFLAETRTVFFYENLKNEKAGAESGDAAAIEKIKALISSKNVKDLSDFLRQLLDSTLQKQGNLDLLDQKLIEIFLTVHMQAYKMGTIEQPSVEEIERFRRKIQEAGSASRKCRILSRDIREICVYLDEVPKVMSRDIQKVIRYVYQNYRQDISLRDLSEAVGLSGNYLCSLFKQETGKRLMEFINTVRINRAKTLLLETNMKVYEISKLVGYHNTTYFSTMFKKITHQTIMEYKKLSGQN